MKRARIALIGDRSEAVIAHRAIPRALELAREKTGAQVEWEWVATSRIGRTARDLEGFSAIWVVPASPYENADGVFDALRWAREGGRPVLGTCGGFQHALVEFARNAAGITDADHAETCPGGASLLVTPLSCSMVEKTGTVHFEKGSLLASAFGAESSSEEYHCNYGFNPGFRKRMEDAGLRFTAWDDAGEIRGAELPSHPFFAGVLFQPERAGLRGDAPPLVTAFVKAAATP